MAGLADRYVVLLPCAADRAPSACAAKFWQHFKVLHVKVGRRLGKQQGHGVQPSSRA